MIDPSGRNETGDPVPWENSLVLRTGLRDDGSKRQVELFVAPRGEIRYSLDGREPRDGDPYDEPILIGDSEVLLRAFATADGIDTKTDFRFAAKGEKGIKVDEAEPARLVSRTGHKLDSRAATFEGLAEARNVSAEFEGVTLTVGQTPKVASISIAAVLVDAAILTELLTVMSARFLPDVPITMTFRSAHFGSGHDLKQFCATLRLNITQESVEQ